MIRTPLVFLLIGACGGKAVIDAEASDDPIEDPPVEEALGCVDVDGCCELVLELRLATCPPRPGVESRCADTTDRSDACVAAWHALSLCILATPEMIVCDERGSDRILCGFCDDELADSTSHCGAARECLAR